MLLIFIALSSFKQSAVLEFAPTTLIGCDDIATRQRLLNPARNGQAAHVSCRSGISRRDGTTGEFQDRHGLLASDAFEFFQKLIKA